MRERSPRQRIKEVVFAASRLPRDQRLPYVDRVLRDDAELRREVHSLLEWLDGEDPASEAASELDASERLGDRYRVLGLLGEGGAGAVYLAHDELLDVPVAIKRALGRDPRQQAELRREALIARSVHHPNVRRVHDVFPWRDELCVVMEYLDGRDLAARLREEGAFASEEVVSLALDLAAGLDALHQAGIVHGDLKPENVLLDVRGSVRLTDFGIAHRDGDGAQNVPSGGTPRYLAPERRAGASPSPSDDVYALAVLLRDLLLGRPEGSDAFADHLPAVDALVPDLSPHLAEAIRRGLLPQSRRPAHAGELLEILRGGTPARDAARSITRRPVTALWCELRSGAEGVSVDSARRRKLAAEIARAHGGSPAETWSAAGLLAFFGVFDSTDRNETLAVRAALEIGARLRDSSGTAPSVAIDTQVTTVLVEDGCPLLEEEFDALRGRAQLGDAGRVVISEALRASIGERFAVWPLEIGGGYEVLFERRSKSMEVARRPGGASVVGRETEKQALLDVWEDVWRTGRGALVAVHGAPGIGKTRLLGEVGNALRDTCRWIEVAGRDERSGALEPWREVLEQISGEEIPAVGLADHLLGPPAAEMSPVLRRACLMDAVVEAVAALGRSGPAVLVVEDLQWCDAASLEILARVAAGVEELGLLVLVSWRSEFTGFEVAPARRHIALGALAACDTEAMLAELLGAVDARARVLVERSGGVPLFVEHMVRAVRAGARPDAIPSSLLGLVLSRLDRLGPVAEVARAASVIGREFSRAMLAHVTGLAAADLDSALHALGAEGIVEPLPPPQEDIYRFAHSLLREGAYESNPAGARRSLHEACVAAIRADVSGSDGGRLHDLARHLEGAGRRDEAIAAWVDAARHAAALDAPASAIEYFARALALGPDRSRELEIRLAKLGAQQILLAFSLDGTSENVERVLELLASSPNPELTAPLMVLGRTYIARADLRLKSLGEQLDPIAERSPDSLLRYGWFVHCGNREAVQGHLRKAREWFLRGVEGMERLVREESAKPESPDQRVFGAAGLAIVEAMRCSPASRIHAAQAVATARALGDRAALCYALVHGAQAKLVDPDAAAVPPLLEEARVLAEAQRIEAYEALGAMFRACAEAEAGDPDRAALAIRSSLAACHAVGFALFEAFGLSFLALAEERRGDERAARAAIERGIELADTTLDRIWLAELQRQRAAQKARLGAPAAEVAAGYERAIAIAREQDAVTLELRARTDLAIWQPDPAARARARSSLAALVQRPGLDPASRDLIRAQAVLAAG